MTLELITQQEEDTDMQIPEMEFSRQEKSKCGGAQAAINRIEGQWNQMAELQRTKERWVGGVVEKMDKGQGKEAKFFNKEYGLSSGCNGGFQQGSPMI